MSWTLPCDVLCVGLANGRRNISRSLKLLCLKRNIGNLSAIQEKSGYLLRQRGNERMSATLPESLFLKALTEGLPMIRPGAVDICRPVMVRYSVIYGVTR